LDHSFTVNAIDHLKNVYSWTNILDIGPGTTFPSTNQILGLGLGLGFGWSVQAVNVVMQD